VTSSWSFICHLRWLWLHQGNWPQSGQAKLWWPCIYGKSSFGYSCKGASNTGYRPV